MFDAIGEVGPDDDFQYLRIRCAPVALAMTTVLCRPGIHRERFGLDSCSFGNGVSEGARRDVWALVAKQFPLHEGWHFRQQLRPSTVNGN